MESNQCRAPLPLLELVNGPIRSAAMLDKSFNHITYCVWDRLVRLIRNVLLCLLEYGQPKNLVATSFFALLTEVRTHLHTHMCKFHTRAKPIAPTYIANIYLNNRCLAAVIFQVSLTRHLKTSCVPSINLQCFTDIHCTRSCFTSV